MRCRNKITSHMGYLWMDDRNNLIIMTPFSPALWLPLLLFFSLLFLLEKKLLGVKKKRNEPPGPPKLPIIGNLHQVAALAHQSLSQLSKKYGPVMLLHLGFIPTLVVSSAESAKQVLKDHDIACCSRPPMIFTRRLSYNYLDIAFAPYGPSWRESRKICVLHLFSARRMQSFQAVREAEIASLIDSLEHSSSSSSATTPVDLTDKIMFLTASMICRIAFGRSFEGSEFGEGRFQEVVHEANRMIGSFFAADVFPYVGWLVDRFTGSHAKLEKSFHELDRFFQLVIGEHLNRPERMKEENIEDLIDVLLNLEKEHDEFSEFRITKDHVKAILMDLLLAGVDTSAITLVWAMAELVRRPEMMKKVQDEVRSCIGDKGKVRETDVEQLHYLKMVVKETLRLHPPAPLPLPKETMSSIEICGYQIYPKTRIYVNVWAIGRDPNLWNNPEEFLPERFIDNTIDFRGQDFEFLPFGGGRRICPAINMGIAMVELTLANLLFHFNWRLPDGMKEEDIDMEEAPGLTVRKKIALSLVPVKYTF